MHAGGYTVFPLVGTYVKPSKGSMVVWWNMDMVGGYDRRLRHAACPVMLGSKWVITKWIRRNSLIFVRPCPNYAFRNSQEFGRSTYYQKNKYITDP